MNHEIPRHLEGCHLPNLERFHVVIVTYGVSRVSCCSCTMFNEIRNSLDICGVGADRLGHKKCFYHNFSLFRLQI